MNEVIRFLASVTQALTQMMQHDPGHPSRRRAVDISYGFLLILHETEPRPRFTFAGPRVRYGALPIRELRDWEWARRLTEVGVHWMEFDRGIRPEEYEVFLEELLARLTLVLDDVAPDGTHVRAGVRFGTLAPDDLEDEAEPAAVIAPTLRYPLQEAAAALGWAFAEVEAGAPLPVLEVESVMRTLATALHADARRQVPWIAAEAAPGVASAVAHAMNTSAVAMALAEWMAIPVKDARAIGVAALLHDLGMLRVPEAVLATPGPLDAEATALVACHPVDGARWIVEADRDLDLAAVVAYEHHRRADGGGYPPVRQAAELHRASAIVQVCSVYDALRAPRPHRAAWTAEAALAHVETGAGTAFDRAAATAFVSMWRTADLQIVVADAALDLTLTAAPVAR